MSKRKSRNLSEPARDAKYEGRNNAMIGTYELATGQRVPLKPGVGLAVCSYVLRIQPR